MQGHKHHRTKEAPLAGSSLTSAFLFYQDVVVPVTSVLTIKSPQQCTDKESQPEVTTGTFLSDKTHAAGCLLSLHQDFIDCGPPLAATNRLMLLRLHRVCTAPLF